MSLTLSRLALEEYLPHLAARRASGTLTVQTHAFRKRIYLLDGRLAGIASGNPREVLGHFLLGWKLISEDQLTEAMELQEKLAAPLGRILERLGAVSAKDLETALVAQAEEALLELFLVPVVERVFLENVLPSGHPLALRLPIQPLVMEGVRRRHRFQELRRILGAASVVPSRTDGPVPGGLTARERLILAEVDGDRDIDGIALAGRVAPFHVAELVARGAAEGFLEIASQQESTLIRDPASLVTEAEGALAAGDLRNCWQQLMLLRDADTVGQFRRHQERLLRGIVETLATRRIAGNLIPWVIPRSSAGALPPLSPAEAFALSRINDRWSLREVQRLTPVEELHFWVIIDTLLQLDLIELRHPRGGPASACVPG